MFLELLVIVFSFTSYILFFDKSKSWYKKWNAELFTWFAELDVFFHNIKEIRGELLEVKNILKNSQLMNSQVSSEVIFESDVELVENDEVFHNKVEEPVVETDEQEQDEQEQDEQKP